jgi:hypothetical protein
MSYQQLGEFTYVIVPEPAYRHTETDNIMRHGEWQCTLFRKDDVVAGALGTYGYCIRWVHDTIAEMGGEE